MSKIIDGLKKKGQIDKWFYLFENDTLRIRLHCIKSNKLQNEVEKLSLKAGLTISAEKPFEAYWETTDAFADVMVAETFADIMSSLTDLTITRLDVNKFSNFILAERLTHCIFNNIYGTNTEKYFLLKKLGLDFQSNDDPELTLLDESANYQTVTISNISIGSFLIPVKIKKA